MDLKALREKLVNENLSVFDLTSTILKLLDIIEVQRDALGEMKRVKFDSGDSIHELERRALLAQKAITKTDEMLGEL
jgi:hypothetical protein